MKNAFNRVATSIDCKVLEIDEQGLISVLSSTAGNKNLDVHLLEDRDGDVLLAIWVWHLNSWEIWYYESPYNH